MGGRLLRIQPVIHGDRRALKDKIKNLGRADAHRNPGKLLARRGDHRHRKQLRRLRPELDDKSIHFILDADLRVLVFRTGPDLSLEMVSGIRLIPRRRDDTSSSPGADEIKPAGQRTRFAVAPHAVSKGQADDQRHIFDIGQGIQIRYRHHNIIFLIGLRIRTDHVVPHETFFGRL